MDTCRTQPCNKCPYRLDAPLQHWHRSEFERLLNNDEQWGLVYACHKKDGHICVGWLMDQVRHRLPNINLRLLLSKNQVTVEYLDKLHCSSGLYKDVREMIKANYPELITDDHEKEKQ